ncbi:MAG: hypothetical protein K6A14_07905 [Erysipelotrichaceae bacterium]|nr:hypothetical protein [Erysipelotrichaceae bacterium]
MITLQQAISKARELNPDFDIYSEYESAYVFCREEYIDNIGGEGTPLVILKDTGEAINFIAFLQEKRRDEKLLKENVRF